MCCEAFVNSRAQNAVCAITNSARLPAGAPRRDCLQAQLAGGSPASAWLARVPPHPLLCFLEDTTGKTLGRCPKPRWGLNPQTPLALRGREFTSVTRQNRSPQSVVSSRGTRLLTQSQTVRDCLQAQLAGGSPASAWLARVPPHPLLCFLEDTTGKTLGRCPKPRWGLNPQTPLALRGREFTFVTRQNRSL